MLKHLTNRRKLTPVQYRMLKAINRRPRTKYNTVSKVKAVKGKGRNDNEVAMLKCIGFPKRLFIQLKYVSDLVTFTCTSGSSIYYQFNLNDLYDVDLTGTGHQPMCYDQWQNFYGNYLVHGCEVSWELSNITDTKPFSAVLVGNDGTGGSSNLLNARELLRGNRNSKSGVCKVGGNDNKVVFLKKYFKPWEQVGISKSQYLDERPIYGATWGASPTTKISCQAWVQPHDESSSIVVKGRSSMIFYCEFGSPQELSQS